MENKSLDSVKRYTPDCSMHMSHEMAFMRETPEGGYVEYQDHLAVKTQRDNLAARVTELELVLQGLPQAAIDGGWTAKGISGYVSKLEKQVKELLSQKENKLTDNQGAQQVKASGFILGNGNGYDEYIFKSFYGQEIKIGDRLYTASSSKSGGE